MCVFSEAIDSLVESGISLEDFLTAIASRLDRVVEGDVCGRRLKGVPEGVSRWSRVGASEYIVGESNVAFRINPPLPDLAGRFVGQRLVHAAKLIAQRASPAGAEEHDGDRVRSLLSASGTEGQRARLLQRLGLDSASHLTVAAIAGDHGKLERAEHVAGALAAGTPVVTARVGDVLAVILQHSPSLKIGVPEGLAIGIGEPLPPDRVHDSWEGAKTALRFSLPSRSSRATHRIIDAVIVDVRKMGCLRVLAEAVDRRDVQDLPDIQAIHVLADNGLPDTLNVLEAVAATESIRQAAQLVHLHHNTVAHRVEAAEEVLGFPLREIYGRTRLLIALTLYRLFRSSERSRPESLVSRPRAAV